MKISVQWIKELMPNLTLSGKEIAELLTNHSFETVVDREYVIDPNITVVQILKLEQHPNADRLRLATITDGTQELTVVCGAPNISEGDVVPYSPPGTKVYDETGELFTLSVAKTRGVESPGMLNSARELGLSAHHGGIVLLPVDVKLGTKLCEYIPSDTVLDADVLPDRAKDVTGHDGVARELSAITGIPLTGNAQETEWKKLLAEVAELAPFIGEQAVLSTDVTRSIAFHPDRPSKMAGIEISHEEVRDILQRLGFSIEEDGNIWAVVPPAGRLDVLGEHDIVDEVIRMIGYDRIPASEYTSHVHAQAVSDEVYWKQKIRECLVELGFTETYSYSFEDARVAALVNSDIHPHVELINPVAPEMKKLRYSMLPGLISAMITSRDEMHRNKKNQERALFEIGRVYHVGDGGVVPGVVERKPVSMIMVGDEHILQETLDALCDVFGISGYEVKTADKPFGKSFMYLYAGEFLATGYVLSRELLAKLKYRMPLVALEVSIPALIKHAPDVEVPVKTLEDVRLAFQQPAQFTELPKFPSVFRDISMLVASDVKIDKVQQEISRVGGKLVVDVDLFDEFSEEGSDTKSLAFHIEYRSAEKTLNDSEVTEIHKKIEYTLKKEFGAEIR